MAPPSITRARLAQAAGELLGRGAFRAVYGLPGDRWVYKIPIEPNMANEWELSAQTEQQETPYLPEGVRLPELVRVFGEDDTCVIAAERIPDRLPPHPDQLDCTCPEDTRWDGCWVLAAIDTAELTDVRVDDQGYLVLLDMAQ
jgi:hypothetical protein